MLSKMACALSAGSNQNVILEYRYAEGKAERFPELVNELVRLPVDVIVAGPAPAAVAAKKATTTISIVITLGADPFAFGLTSRPRLHQTVFTRRPSAEIGQLNLLRCE